MMRSVWDDIENMHEEMDDLFNWMYGRPRKQMIWQSDFRQPLCCMDWKGDKLHTELELPGVDKKDIQLNVGEGFLEVKVDKKEESEKSGKDSRQVVMRRNQFYRRLPLPENVDTGNVIAEFHNGLLKIDMAKKQIAHDKVKQIEIK